VHSTPGSYNNEIGVPLVLLGCAHDHDVVVCEMGARRPGDVTQLVRLARPIVGVVTGIGVTHLGVFGDRRTIARSKAELVALPADGHAILPAGDDFLHMLASATPAEVTTVGPGGRVRIGGVALDAHGRPSATVSVGGREVGIRLDLPGRPLLRNAAFALAVAHVLGVDLDAAAAAISTAPTSAWRMEVHRAGTRTIVNDAYNANPTSVEAALRTVREMAGGREAWAVLGEMAELGEASDAEHVRIGRLAHALGFTGVVAVGSGAARILDGASGIGQAAPEAADAALFVDATAAPDAVVLVKGSRVAGLERAAELLRLGVEVAG
jgi:UDP-N-acetylmuramoyl-tripeptide--D-alanyl-D-alanine ligase